MSGYFFFCYFMRFNLNNLNYYCSAAYARAESSIRNFIDTTQIPFLPTPMAKGLLPDTHPLCISPARSTALQSANVILLLGARLNWILHFGLPPRFAKDVKFMQVDICPEECFHSLTNSVGVMGDIDAVTRQLNDYIRQENIAFSKRHDWFNLLSDKVAKNQLSMSKLVSNASIPMGYYRAFHEIRTILDNQVHRPVFFVGEGANTMDIGRTMIQQHTPRTRLDAGTFGTMGVGLGFAIAAQLTHPDHLVVAIQGDSAFGFSAMEIETAARYKIPLLIIVMNNSGIYSGMDNESFSNVPVEKLPSTVLLPGTRYELLGEMVGGKGISVSTPEELKNGLCEALKWVLEKRKVVVMNVVIDPRGTRRAQVSFGLLLLFR